jgi:hypothetical protein
MRGGVFRFEETQMAARDHDEIPVGIREAFRRGAILDDRRSGESDRRDDDAFRVKWSIVLQVVSWAIGLFVIYNAMTSRLTALETNRANDTQRMERIESKLDRLLEQRK